MKTKIDCSWKRDMVFEAEVNGFKILLDAEPEMGGMSSGPRPKALTLASLAGCTGMDVISLLRKMQSEPDFFNVSVEGEPKDCHPKYFFKIHIIYELKGKNVDPEKVEKAVSLSLERYCAVNALLRPGSEITHEIRIQP